MSSRSVNIGRVIATTNYDMSLELYFLKKDIPIIDGFKDRGAYQKYYDPLILLNPYDREGKTIIKLHGSIFYFSEGDNVIKVKPYSKDMPYRIDIGREMMIYPTREKDILISPYYSLYNAFRNIKWTKLLVIGYSFRDEPINTAILDNMKYNNSQLIVINPNPNEVIENLYLNTLDNFKWKIPRNRLFKFSGKFGSSEAFDYLKRIETVSDNQDSDFDPTRLEKSTWIQMLKSHSRRFIRHGKEEKK